MAFRTWWHWSVPKCLRSLRIPILVLMLVSCMTSTITLHYITLHHITLHHITLHHITLHHITLHYITSHYITSHYITSHYITLHHITLYYITLHYITLHYITLHSPMLSCANRFSVRPKFRHWSLRAGQDGQYFFYWPLERCLQVNITVSRGTGIVLCIQNRSWTGHSSLSFFGTSS